MLGIPLMQNFAKKIANLAIYCTFSHSLPSHTLYKKCTQGAYFFLRISLEFLEISRLNLMSSLSSTFSI